MQQNLVVVRSTDPPYENESIDECDAWIMWISHFDEFAYSVSDESSWEYNYDNFDDHLCIAANLYETKVVRATFLHDYIYIILTKISE